MRRQEDDKDKMRSNCITVYQRNLEANRAQHQRVVEYFSNPENFPLEKGNLVMRKGQLVKVESAIGYVLTFPINGQLQKLRDTIHMHTLGSSAYGMFLGWVDEDYAGILLGDEMVGVLRDNIRRAWADQ